ncbi:transglutaminaseTgpA domain-containing protein [Actinotalea sp. M2MS4P-6]|uniref:transglutaminase family protein n=1 Tax=Actinotalea sp. M2MS4P-6 TaxID=2983762 RepID=UPI0021E36CD2|nr:transglutaminaseTgpA domain-containing protein [Actinotalea sp. M2MS4P-6]MCV2393431.1 transglutaminaseTgpA domain-containing protein [Actinotalea sp. M2MS4P-6]
MIHEWLAGRTAVTGVRAWLGALVMLVGLRIGLSSLGSLIAPGPWLATATVAVAVVLLAAAVVRWIGPAEWAPVGALAAGVLVIVIGYGGDDGPGLSGWSTPATLTALVRDGAATINDGHIPVVAGRGLELLVVIGAVAAAVVVDALAIGLRLAGAAGIAMAAMWAPTLVFERPPGTLGLIGGAVCWLLLVWITRPPRGREPEPWRELPVAAVVAAAVAVGAVLLTPLVTSLPGYGRLVLPATWGPGLYGAGSVALSDDLDMRADLGGRSGFEALRYTTDIADVGPLRTQTLTVFDGTRWTPGDRGVGVPADGQLWPSAVASQTTGTITVTLSRIEQGTLPIPLEPRILSLGGGWSYDPVRDEVSGPVSEGLVYQAEIAPRDLTPEALRADSVGTVPEGSAELTVPDTAYADQIGALAHDVVGDAPTTYDEALALQSWFRGTDFTYQTQLAPAQTSDAVWDFLQSKTGYCVQYATAMAVMARDLGIPARVGVGFLPGERDAAGVVSVSWARAHAWPELYFAGAGWVRFEPTPGVQTGAPPAYADPAIESLGEDPSLVPDTQQTDAPESSGAPQQNEGGTNAGGATDGSSSWWPWLAGAGLLVVAGVGWWAVRRRREQVWGPEEAWALLRRDAAERGVEWSDATTPRQAGAVLRAALRDPGSPGEQAIDEMVAILEAHRYAPAPQPVDGVDLLALVERTTAALSAARGAAPSAPRNG